MVQELRTPILKVCLFPQREKEREERRERERAVLGSMGA
jgi:hypothetical protein